MPAGAIRALRQPDPSAATDDERDAQAGGLIGHVVQSNEPVAMVAALAVSLASKRH